VHRRNKAAANGCKHNANKDKHSKCTKACEVQAVADDNSYNDIPFPLSKEGKEEQVKDKQPEVQEEAQEVQEVVQQQPEAQEEVQEVQPVQPQPEEQAEDTQADVPKEVQQVQEEVQQQVQQQPDESRELFETQENQVENLQDEPAEAEKQGDDIMKKTGETKDKDEEELEKERFVVDGKVIYIMYNRSFTAKIIQADAVIQDRYSQLKNEIMSYGARARMSWTNDSFSCGRKTVAKFALRGKTLSLYLALTPSKYEETKYIYEDVSQIKKYAGVPMKLKLRSDRSVKWAKELIADLMAENEKEQGDIPTTVYSYPYESTEELVKKALIKVYSNGNGKAEEVAYADFEALRKEKFKEITGLEVLPKVTAVQAQESITDEEAEQFIEVEKVPEEQVQNAQKQTGTTNKKVKGIINIDVISVNFKGGDVVTIKEMKNKGLIDKKVTYVKVLARGEIDKPLQVTADDFSLQAVKMIVMTGGCVKKTAQI
jgi:ribosomal protein L15